MSELQDMLRVQARLHRKQGANALGDLFQSAALEIEILTERLENPQGLQVDAPAHRGQFQAIAGTVEQLSPGLEFQRLQSLAHRRLGSIEPLCCRFHRAGFYHSSQHSELVELHWQLPMFSTSYIDRKNI